MRTRHCGLTAHGAPHLTRGPTPYLIRGTTKWLQTHPHLKPSPETSKSQTLIRPPAMAFSGRMRELMHKYGKVALGVHFSVSAASIAGLYVAINNNVDVEALFQKIGLRGNTTDTPSPSSDPTVILDEGLTPPPATTEGAGVEKKKNRTAELAASSGGALAVAVLCNKALFPVRVPITIALTPPIARFLRARNIIKK